MYDVTTLFVTSYFVLDSAQVGKGARFKPGPISNLAVQFTYIEPS